MINQGTQHKTTDPVTRSLMSKCPCLSPARVLLLRTLLTDSQSIPHRKTMDETPSDSELHYSSLVSKHIYDLSNLELL